MKLKQDFHPRLFGFAGFSGAGKTTLIEKLIKEFSDYRIGYIKHDAHHFEMDHPGKDTFRQYAAGANMVFINDSEHQALQLRGESFTLEKEYFKDCDLVFVEGHKYSPHPKFLFLDETLESEYQEGKITGVLGTISSDGRGLDGLPAFHRDDVSSIADFIKKKITESIQAMEVYGLVLAGGQSSRMGTDKSLLNYHGRPQAQHLFQLMEGLGLKTYLSCRSEQATHSEFKDLPMITDRFIDFGPLGGILSAMASHPGKAWFVVACDLPLVTSLTMEELLAERDPLKQATAYFNIERKHFEPLFAIYEPRIYSRMLHFLGEGMTCPQKVLFNSHIKCLELKSQGPLENVNTPEERAKVLEALTGENA